MTARLAPALLLVALCGAPALGQIPLCPAVALGQAEGAPAPAQWTEDAIAAEVQERIAAIQAAVDMSEAEAMRLRRAVEAVDEEPGDNRRIFNLLRQQRKKTVLVLKPALVDTDARLRRKAARCLGHIAIRDGVAASDDRNLQEIVLLLFVRSAKDEDPGVRNIAAGGLTGVGTCDRRHGQVAPDLQVDRQLWDLLVQTLREMRHDSSVTVRWIAASGLFQIGEGPDPDELWQARGFALVAATIGLEFRPGDPLPLVLALGYARPEATYIARYSCEVRVTDEQGQDRVVPLIEAQTGRDRGIEEIDLPVGRRAVEPVERIEPNACIAQVLPDVLQGVGPLAAGTYTMVLAMKIREYEADFVVEREGVDHKLWGRFAQLEGDFRLVSAPVTIEIW